MSFHRNAKLGLSGRFALVQAVFAGMSLKAAAAAFRVSPATAHRWLDASADERETLVCLFDRSSRPRSSPRELAADLQRRICDCRQQTGGSPPGGRRDRLRALDGLEGASPAWALAAATPAQRAGQQLRVALPLRPAHMDVSRYGAVFLASTTTVSFRVSCVPTVTSPTPPPFRSHRSCRRQLYRRPRRGRPPSLPVLSLSRGAGGARRARARPSLRRLPEARRPPSRPSRPPPARAAASRRRARRARRRRRRRRRS